MYIKIKGKTKFCNVYLHGWKITGEQINGDRLSKMSTPCLNKIKVISCIFKAITVVLPLKG